MHRGKPGKNREPGVASTWFARHAPAPAGAGAGTAAARPLHRESVYREIARTFPAVSLVSVYRALEMLCEHGLAACTHLGGTARNMSGRKGGHTIT